MTSTGKRYGAIEAGGTKFVLAVATGTTAGDIVDRAVIPTTDPATTVSACLEFFGAHSLDALGIGTFGPVLLDPGERYGTVARSPKLAWNGTSFHDSFAELGVPMVIDTDVNGAALAEARSTGVPRLVYYTVGTGIGGGVALDGNPISGRPHPELGHMSVERHPDDDFEGLCPHHGGCAEGLAAGPALEARFGVGKGELGQVLDRVVPLAGWYIGQLAANANFFLAPDRVVLGGGILSIPGVFDAASAEAQRRIGAYTLREPGDPEWLIAPTLGDDAGITGALLLAERALVG